LHWDISPATLNLKIPPMMLQTLVENAVKHGISRLKNGGILSIRSFITEDKIEWGVEILNSGVYAPEQNIEKSGVGLVNTRQRLDLIYAGKAKLHIRNKSDGIVETLILLPYAQNSDS
jgi:LytS/YehU family sensor histidine kinase